MCECCGSRPPVERLKVCEPCLLYGATLYHQGRIDGQQAERDLRTSGSGVCCHDPNHSHGAYADPGGPN